MHTVLALMLSLAVVCDLRRRRFPDALTVGGLIAALVVRPVMNPAPATGGFEGAVMGMAVAVPLFTAGVLNAGDSPLLIAMLATAIMGGIMSGIVSWRSGVVIPALQHTKDLLIRLLTLGHVGERTEAAIVMGAVPR